MPIRQWLKVGPQLCTEGINGREEIWGGKREGVLGDTNTLPAMHLKADQGCHSGSWLCLNGVTDAQAPMPEGEGNLGPCSFGHAHAHEVL